MYKYLLVFYLTYFVPKIVCGVTDTGLVRKLEVNSLDTCTDPVTNQTYKLGDKWKSEYPDGCALSSCSNININEYPGYNFPIVIQYKCVDPKPPDNDIRGCHLIRPYSDQPYPNCCKHMVCFRNDYYVVMYPTINEDHGSKFGLYSQDMNRIKRHVAYKTNVTRQLLLNIPRRHVRI